MSALEIRETYVNATESRHIGDSGWYEPFTDDRGRLFRSLQKEYGRVVSYLIPRRSLRASGAYGLAIVAAS